MNLPEAAQTTGGYATPAAQISDAPAIVRAVDSLEGGVGKLGMLLDRLENQLAPVLADSTPHEAVPASPPLGSSPLAAYLGTLENRLRTHVGQLDRILGRLEVGQ